MEDMFCKKCNALLSPGANFCANCGAKVTEEKEENNTYSEKSNNENQEKTKYCSGCGSVIGADKIICPRCGKYTNAQQKSSYSSSNHVYGSNSNDRNNVAAGLLAIFLGTFGIHKFYLGEIGMGIFYILITCFGFIFFCIPNIILQVVVIIEGILYLVTDNETFNKKFNRNYKG